MTYYRCICRCHIALGERERADGVDTSDPIAAASACPICIDRHVRALVEPPPRPYLPPLPTPWPADAVSDQCDGEGKED